MSKFKVWVKMFFFVISFLPLLLIIFANKNIQFSVKSLNISLFYLLVISYVFVGLLFYFWFKSIGNQNNSKEINLGKIQNLNEFTLNYLFTYLFAFIPNFLNEDFSLTSNLGFIIFIIIFVIVYVNTNLIYLNPLFIVLGYNVYRISDKEMDIILLSKSTNLNCLKTVDANILSGNIFIQKEKENED